MVYIFDGREFAKDLEQRTKRKVQRLKQRGITPKLVSIIVGDNPASLLYVGLKKKAAERIGAEVEIKKYDKRVRTSTLIHDIKELDYDDKVHGIMVQLPLPPSFSGSERNEIINSILPEKDVDGMREDSKFTPPTANAVVEVFDEAVNIVRPSLKSGPFKVVVVGSSGFVGSQIMKALKNSDLIDCELVGVDRSTSDFEDVIKNGDFLISATGVPELIKKEMIKDNVVLVDVGSPKGDIEKSAYEKASFVSPVPGGVGPITISCLMENLINSAVT